MIKYKKNLTFQGSSGVGKTFVGKRLAYALIGKVDNDRVEMIQFHQLYSYDDFIQGYRPNKNGRLKRVDGVFYRFFQKVQRR